MRPDQLATLAILDNAQAFDWSLQGFGLLRLYVRQMGRIHIWTDTLRYPGVSMVHNHSWDLHSTIVVGSITNTRYVKTSQLVVDVMPEVAFQFHRQRRITGYNTVETSPIETVCLRQLPAEVYRSGQEYSQIADEIHRTDAVNGTVTIMRRQEDEVGQADIYWPIGTEWGTAKPRKASASEIAEGVAQALRMFTNVAV